MRLSALRTVNWALNPVICGIITFCWKKTVTCVTAPKAIWSNKPLPSCLRPLYQNEVKFSTFDMEMIFHPHANKTNFHKNGCLLGLILKWLWSWYKGIQVPRRPVAPWKRSLTFSRLAHYRQFGENRYCGIRDVATSIPSRCPQVGTSGRGKPFSCEIYLKIAIYWYFYISCHSKVRRQKSEISRIHINRKL